MLDRLTGTPVAVYDAAWTLLLANPLYTALMGDRPAGAATSATRCGATSSARAAASATPRRPGARSRPRWSPTCARPPAGIPPTSGCGALIAELRANSDRFAELWDSGAVGRHEAARKTIDHPQVGPLTLDCDVLTVAGSDLRIMIYTAEPGTEDAERLALLAVLGTQTLVG